MNISQDQLTVECRIRLPDVVLVDLVNFPHLQQALTASKFDQRLSVFLSMNKEQAPKQLGQIKTLQIVSHHLPLTAESNKQNKGYGLAACGFLTGKFQQEVYLPHDEELIFIGDFQGFFQSYENLVRGEVIYFQGTIENFQLLGFNISDISKRTQQTQIAIKVQTQLKEYYNKNKKSADAVIKKNIKDDISKQFEQERLKKLRKIQHQVNEGQFVGWFHGKIRYDCQQSNQIYKFKPEGIRRIPTIKKNVLVKKQNCRIVPVFTCFVLKKINDIDLDKSSATISGTMKIYVQLSQQIVDIIKRDRKKLYKILIVLPRECSMQLPIRLQPNSNKVGINKDFNEGLFDILTQYNEDTKCISYTIRKKFHAKIDGSFKQFLSPFNLVNLQICLTYTDLKLKTPNSDEQTILKFLNYDFDDRLKADNPFCSFNDFLILDYQQREKKYKGRAAKITYDANIETDSYFVAPSYFSLFTHYNTNFMNSNDAGSDYSWTMGFKKYHQHIQKQPEVLAISEKWKKTNGGYFVKDENQNQKYKSMQFCQWNSVHIRIPIYKSWMLIMIQIFFPMLLLSTLNIFIFVQQNGIKASDHTTTLNSRIANVANIIIAFVALIPVIKQSGPRASNISFVYLVIIFSSIPNLLALISSIISSNITVTEWKQNYNAFTDKLFLIAFGLTIFLLAFVMFLLFYFLRKQQQKYQRLSPIESFMVQKEIQIMNSHSFQSKQFRRFKYTQSHEPLDFQSYAEKIRRFRGQQFIIGTPNRNEETRVNHGQLH